MTQIIGAFVPARIWKSWSPDEADRELQALRDYGINTIFTESETYRDKLIDLAHKLGMKFIGGLACFHDPAILQERPELWPILENGKQRPQMEWYIGVTPTYEDYNETRLEIIERIARDHDLDGFGLDFVRWPLHWELELRPEAPRPLQSSFDTHSVARFLEYANLDMPADCDSISKQAAWILDEHRSPWTDFKCSVISDFVAQAKERIKLHRGEVTDLGVYLVPDEQSDYLVGQRVSELAQLVDFIAPMVYHAILHRPPEWVAGLVDAIAPLAPRKLLPVLQVDSETDGESDADLGPPLSVNEWQQIICDAASRDDTLGLIAFTSAMLFRDGRGQILNECVTKSNR